MNSAPSCFNFSAALWRLCIVFSLLILPFRSAHVHADVISVMPSIPIFFSLHGIGIDFFRLNLGSGDANFDCGNLYKDPRATPKPKGEL
eukprot:UC4_evm5s1221